jgi:hypothetical protein
MKEFPAGDLPEERLDTSGSRVLVINPRLVFRVKVYFLFKVKRPWLF